MESAAIPCHADHDSRDPLPSRVSLRPLDPSDVEDFMVWATDERVTRFCTWEPYASREEAMRFLEDKVVPHSWFMAICYDHRPVGAISVTAKSGCDACRAELGYVLGSAHWGKGIVTEAVRLAREALFGEWAQLERLEAYVDVGNVGSQKVLEKSGFVKEGVLRKYMLLKGNLRDMVVFSLLRTD